MRSILKPRTPSPADETPRRLPFRRIRCESAAAVARGWHWHRNRRPLAAGGMVPAHGQVPCADASEAAPSCPQVSTPMALGFALVMWHDTGRDLIS